MPEQTSTEPPLRWIDRLFLRMGELYGNKWSEYIALAGGPKRAAELWQSALAGISADELKRGLDGCLKSGNGWPPELPVFRAMCRPPRDPEHEFERAAYILGCQPINWKGDAVLYAAVRAVGAFDVRTRPYTGSLKSRWEKALRDAESRDILPPPPEPPIAALAEKRTDPAVARSMLASIKNQFFGESRE